MTDTDKDKAQATPAGTPSNDAEGGGTQPGTGKTFTQGELDAIIADRLARQKQQFADYPDLKAKAQKWAELEEQQKSEAQKLTEARAKAERERDEALQRAQSRLIRASFMAEAAKAGAAHPDDVYALADVSKITLDADDNVLGVSEAVQAVIAAGRVPIMQPPRAPSLDAGAGGGRRPAEGDKIALSEAEMEIARKLRITPEEYAKGKNR